MVQGESAVILSYDDKGRAESVLLYAEAAGDSLDETCLASSQLAGEKNDVALLSQLAQALSQELSLPGAIGP